MKKRAYSIIATLAVTCLLLEYISVLSASTQATLSVDNEWQLEISGLVEHPLNLTLSEIRSMPLTTVEATIYCVDFPGRIVETGSWTGVQLGLLLEKAGVSPSAMKIALYASDGYATDLSLEAATQPDVIIAYEKDNVPLGETLRLVVPERWGYKWISQLTKIEIVDFDFRGRWESQGYSDDGNQTGGGSPPIPVLPPVPNQTPIQQNITTIPSTSPTPTSSNSSSNLPPQETENPAPEEPEPKNPGPFPTTPIVVVSVIAVATAAAVLPVYLKKRRH